MIQFNIGDTVEVTARNGGLFNSSYYGETGTVVSVNTTSQIIHVDFESGRDYGNFKDVRVVRRVANALEVGARVQVTAYAGGRFLSRFANKFGTVIEIDEDDVTVEFEGGGTDYGSHSDVKVVAPANAQIAPRPADVAKNGMTVGDRVRVNSEESKRGSFYTRYCGKTGTITHYRLALPVVGGETLEAQLASLRAKHNAIKAEKQAAEAEVAAARTKVNEIEARRVALVSVLTANGLQFAE